MKRLILLAALLFAVPAFAALPPPTPEEAAAAAAKKAKADETAKQAAEFLVKAQDRAVQNYKRNQSTLSP
jgi:hypothetical protein